MATPARITWLQSIVTALDAISSGSGYHTASVSVERVYKTWDDLSPSQVPYIGILPIENTLEYHGGRRIEQTSRVNLYCFVGGTTPTTRTTALENLLDDIIKALGADTTHGASAIHTTLLAYVTDEGDQDAPAGIASMEVQALVKFERSMDGT